MSDSLVAKSSSCTACGSKNLIEYLSLGETALANAYLAKEDLGRPELKAPLEVYYCHDCHLSQLLHLVDRGLLFKNYAYFSSTSPQLLKHFDDYASEIIHRFPIQTKKLVLEIASNDGILLKAFKGRGAKVLGVDPAENIAATANASEIPTIPKFFGMAIVPEILASYGKAGLITANNVLAHTDNVNSIVAGTKQLLDPQGVFVFQIKYLGDLLEKNEFDTIYHEHVSYFALLPLVSLLRRHDLKIFDVERVETEGGSLRVFAAHAKSPFPENVAVESLLQEERERGLDKIATYFSFGNRPQMFKTQLVSIIKDLRSRNKKIAGYGASAKGNTLLQYCGIGPESLSYITDNAPLKQGKYTPGTHIPIVPPGKLSEDRPDYVLLLAWNYASSILQNESGLRKRGVKFIIPIPKIEIV